MRPTDLMFIIDLDASPRAFTLSCLNWDNLLYNHPTGE